MLSIQSKHAQLINLRHDRVGPLFQGRYKSKLIDADSYALAVTRYIHRNPVEIGYASFQNYAWSSYSSYTRNDSKNKWLDTSFMLNYFDTNRRTALQKFNQFHQIVPGGPGPIGTYRPDF
jgi:hypothetical protein